MIDVESVLWFSVGMFAMSCLLSLAIAFRLQAVIDSIERISNLREKLVWDRIKELEHKIISKEAGRG